ncbi:hypothetical protein [Pseudorhodoferax sp.]|uniref:hypothetical protein n=1 Tax=Pseudorhodoferax sp. TaxID=1993553 RepID=UPI0039E482D6
MIKPASPRALNVKTPGAADADQETAAGDAEDLEQETGHAGAGGGDPQPQQLPPDLDALIAAKVAEGMAKERAKQRKAIEVPLRPTGVLPTQDEAIRIVKARGGRAVLSQDGYVCQNPLDAKIERDVNGFAKT